MRQRDPIWFLHMGCGEPLRTSQLSLVVQTEGRLENHKRRPVKTKRGGEGHEDKC